MVRREICRPSCRLLGTTFTVAYAYFDNQFIILFEKGTKRQI